MAMADVRFAQHTNAILNSLPYWFKMRKGSADSIGARFLNVSGLELDDALFCLEYAYDQCYLSTCDIDQVDFCYKAVIPMPIRVSEVENVSANRNSLIKAKDLKQFFGVDQKGIRDVQDHSFEFYYLDKERNIIYVRNKFNIDALNENGKITLKWNGEDYTFSLQPHPIWNYFDEIGTLLSCPRIFGEPNIEYRARIADVFRNKASSSRDGLINGIARELSLRRNIVWMNPSEDIELVDPMVVLNSIKLNGEYLDMSRIFISEYGTVILKGDGTTTNPGDISYVHGLEMHQLHKARKSGRRDVRMLINGKATIIKEDYDEYPDIKFSNELFTVEGKPKQLLRNYINTIERESPIFWDHFHWNEHYWDMNDPGVTGVGFIPNLYDGSTKGFKAYGVK